MVLSRSEPVSLSKEQAGKAFTPAMVKKLNGALNQIKK